VTVCFTVFDKLLQFMCFDELVWSAAVEVVELLSRYGVRERVIATVTWHLRMRGWWR